MNTPVNYETAVLLKEKGFDEPCLAYWNGKEPFFNSPNGTVPLSSIYTHRNTFLCRDRKVIPNEDDYAEDIKLNPDKYQRLPWGMKVAAPTISEVVMWLYGVHSLWINVTMENNEEDIISFGCGILKNINNETYFKQRLSDFKSPPEAYEAGILYCLEHLND